MAQGERDYSLAAAEKAFKVEDWLAGGELLEWRSIKETAEAVGLSQNEAHRCLHTLVKCGRAEQSDKWWRISPDGIIRHAFYVQEYLAKQNERLTGPRRLI